MSSVEALADRWEELTDGTLNAREEMIAVTPLIESILGRTFGAYKDNYPLTGDEGLEGRCKYL